MKIRIMVVPIFTLFVFLLTGCIKLYASPPVGESTQVPEQIQNSQSASQPSAQDAPAQPSPASSGNPAQPEPVEVFPDLIPTEITYDSASISVGKEIYFDSGIRNAGSADSDGFNIKWFVNSEKLGHGGHPGIAAGDTDMTSNSQFYWTPQAPGTYQIEFFVDSEETVQEGDETNNSVFVSVQVGAAAWGETPVHLGNSDTLFDVYTEKAEVDLNGDGNLDRIEYHAGKTITINGGVYPSTHENYAQSFAIVDICKNDGHLEILLNPAYRELSGNNAEYPSSWLCWWDGKIIHGYGMKGVMFDKAWREDFVPSNYFFGDYKVMFLTPNNASSSGFSWGEFTFDPVNYGFSLTGMLF